MLRLWPDVDRVPYVDRRDRLLFMNGVDEVGLADPQEKPPQGGVFISESRPASRQNTLAGINRNPHSDVRSSCAKSLWWPNLAERPKIPPIIQMLHRAVAWVIF